MQIYLVGGAVRDKLLGIENHDKDYVVVGATVEKMLSLGFTQVGHDFPVFLHPKTHEEYALARTERKNGTGYLGFNCDFNDFKLPIINSFSSFVQSLNITSISVIGTCLVLVPKSIPKILSKLMFSTFAILKTV